MFYSYKLVFNKMILFHGVVCQRDLLFWYPEYSYLFVKAKRGILHNILQKTAIPLPLVSDSVAIAHGNRMILIMNSNTS